MPMAKMLFLDFLEQSLDNEYYSNNLFWHDRNSRTFGVRFKHKNSATWKPKDASVFVAWDLIKGRKPNTLNDEYYSDARHRVHTALRQSVQKGYLKVEKTPSCYPEMWNDIEFYKFQLSDTQRSSFDDGYLSPPCSPIRDRSPLRRRNDSEASNSNDDYILPPSYAGKVDWNLEPMAENREAESALVPDFFSTFSDTNSTDSWTDNMYIKPPCSPNETSITKSESTSVNAQQTNRTEPDKTLVLEYLTEFVQPFGEQLLKGSLLKDNFSGKVWFFCKESNIFLPLTIDFQQFIVIPKCQDEVKLQIEPASVLE